MWRLISSNLHPRFPIVIPSGKFNKWWIWVHWRLGNKLFKCQTKRPIQTALLSGQQLILRDFQKGTGLTKVFHIYRVLIFIFDFGLLDDLEFVARLSDLVNLTYSSLTSVELAFLSLILLSVLILLTFVVTFGDTWYQKPQILGDEVWLIYSVS